MSMGCTVCLPMIVPDGLSWSDSNDTLVFRDVCDADVTAPDDMSVQMQCVLLGAQPALRLKHGDGLQRQPVTRAIHASTITFRSWKIPEAMLGCCSHEGHAIYCCIAARNSSRSTACPLLQRHHF